MNTVYKAISAVQKELSERGIGKGQYNTFDKYAFRGIDDVYNALGPILAKHELVIFPEVKSRETIERTSQKGGMMLHVILDITYHFVGPDGSSVQVPVIGEAMDRGDKAINKAFSAAYKLACFQTFCIPVEGQDSEQESPTIGAGPKRSTRETDTDASETPVPKRGNRVIDAVVDAGLKFDPAMRDQYVSLLIEAHEKEDSIGAVQLIREFAQDHDLWLAIIERMASAPRNWLKKVWNEARNKQDAEDVAA